MIKSRMFFGLNTNVKRNAYFISNEEILYPTGGVITLHNYEQKSQRYINLLNPEKEISVIAVSLKKKCIAVAEKGDAGEKPRILVYDIDTLQRKTTLGIPFDINTREFLCVHFTHDGTHIAALTGGPDFIMYYYNWQSGKIESQAKANNPPSTPGPVTDMAINPKDATIAVFVGVSLFRLVSMSENVWRQYGFQKAQNFCILSVCWLTDDRVLAGCKDGKIIIVQSGDLNGVYNINDIDEIHIVAVTENKKEPPKKTLSRTLSKQLPIKESDKVEQKIRCFVAINSGFLFSKKSGEVVYFEKTSKTSYKKSTTFVIKKDILREDVNYNDLYFIHCISTNPAGTKVLCTTNRSQVYWVELQSNNDIKEFEIFGEPLHHGPIAGLSTCLWKPIFMTCGEYDNSVRIWNYASANLLLNQTFIEKVNCISLHPTGLYALIGFSDKVRFFLVLISELQVYREFDICQCHILAFSNNGHLFAAECNHDILVFSSTTFHKISCFQGHYQQITALQWSLNDLTLHSSSINGALYQWSIEKSTRISDTVMQEIKIKGLISISEDKIVCIGNDGSIRDIKDSKVVTNVTLKHDNASCLDAIIALHSHKSLLLSGKNGIIISLKYPIGEEIEFEFYSMHNKPVKQFCVMNKERTFVSCGNDGTICIWDIMNTEEAHDKYFEEILINVNELGEKNRNLHHLTSRIKEMVLEHSFEIKRVKNLYQEKIKELEENDSVIIKNLKTRIKTLEKEHSMELNRIHLDITQMKQAHTMYIDKLDSSFNGKLLYEFQKYDTLKDEMEKLKQSYKKQLEELKKSQDSEKESQRIYYQSQIIDLQEEVDQLKKSLALEKQENSETKMQLQNRLKEEIHNLKSTYETQLKTETSKSSDLQTELGITKKKLGMLQKEKEEFKTTKMTAETEHENLKQKQLDLQNQIENFKKIIQTKDTYITNEKKHVSDLKKKIKDLTHTISTIENTIKESEKNIQKSEDQLDQKVEEIQKLKKLIKNEEKEKLKLQNEKSQLGVKLKGKESLLLNQQLEIHNLRTELSHMRNYINNLKDIIQQPDKLKKQIKILLQHVNSSNTKQN